jgi:hypothetical protein
VIVSRRIVVAAVGSALLVGAVAGLAAAVPLGTRGGQALQPGTYKLTASLNTKQTVPRAKGTTSGRGSFTGTLAVTSPSRSKLTWKLTFARLTGPALAAHIHLGPVGKAGKVVVPLCAPCKTGAHGTKSVSRAAATAITTGKAYVNVHTRKNPAGEIRGQVKAKAAAGGGGGGGGQNPYANVVVKPTPALVAQGKTLSSNFGCEGCHTLNGAKSTGPTWKGLAGRKVHLTTGETVTATDGYLILAIEQPDAQIVSGYSSGIMTTAIGNISVAQAKALVAYIRSVK